MFQKAETKSCCNSNIIQEEETLMWGLEELKGHREILDRIDWEMTPEKAVSIYLEWGTSWFRNEDAGSYFGQESLYFVIYEWEKPPQVTLLQRNIKDADEIAKIQVPGELIAGAVAEGGRKPGVGVYAINQELEQWLRRELGC